MSAPSGLHYFEWDAVGDVAVVRFRVSVIRDWQMVQAMFGQLDRLIRQSGQRKILLDFGNIVAFTSYAIGKLVVLNSELRAPEGRLALCNLTPTVKEIVDTMGLRRHLHVYDTEQEALESFD